MSHPLRPRSPRPRPIVWLCAFALALVTGVIAGASTRPATAAPSAQASVPPGSIVVRGRIFYLDREIDRGHPAAGLRVEVWDLDGGFPTTAEKLDETMTDAQGRFESDTLSNVDPDGPTGRREGTQDIFLKLFTDNGDVRLLKTNTTQAYAWTSYEIDADDGISRNVPDGIVGLPPLYIAETTPDIEALWTFVNLADAWLYMRDQAGQDPGKVLAYWSRASQDGPRYDLEERALYFRDEDAGYTQLIVQTEAFALLHNIYAALPEPWKACMTRPPTDIKRAVEPACALVQGFASFLPLAVYGEPSFETPSALPVDVDAAKAGTPGWEDGDAVPGRIAGAFWDLFEGDPTVEEHDAFNATFADIWEVFAKRDPATMRAWWEGWKALGKNGCGAVGSLYQNTIDYNTGPRISPIPDVVIDEDETATLDLANYVDDDECADDTFAYTLVDAGAPEAGVVLASTSVISITPQADWTGETTVRVRVSDGLVDTELSFRVIVRPVNDCPRISPRIPDPEPATYGQPVSLDLAPFGKDPEDGPADLAWTVIVEAPFDKVITVLGAGTSAYTFLLDPSIRENYGARVLVRVRDRAGCEASQTVALYWTSTPNSRPTIDWTRFTREYVAPVNVTIDVDLTGVAQDAEDGAAALEWFVINLDTLNAQVTKVAPQVLAFEPDVGFIGSNVAELEVQDSGGARATAAITLTWKSQIGDVANVPPRILRHRLVGKSVGLGSEACYDLTDKAFDPDDSQASLRWYALDFDDTTLLVGAQGTRRLCMRSRPNYIGCAPARFLVRDPHGGEDSHEVTTCWRQIRVFLPFTVQAR